MKRKGIIVASFGTTYESTRKLCIESIENLVIEKYKDYKVLRAFTSEKIIKILKDRDGIDIYNPKEALEKMKESGINEISILPLLMLAGYEYEKIISQVQSFKAENKDFIINIGKPLLYEESDLHKVIDGLSGEGILQDKAIVFMGHGTGHSRDKVYTELNNLFIKKGFKNIFIGTVEGSKTLDDIILSLRENKIKDVILRPFMLVAGDHAINDMASEKEDSWISILKANEIEAKAVISGFGEIKAMQNIFLENLVTTIG